MENNEALIRDALSTRLEIIEPGLQLLSVEKYLPNPQGTRGFVDLLAKDQRGKYVLIELKRSDASSRQALHEVLKYIEAVKVNLSARDAEIRVLIVSTEWKELLVPFSSFVKRTAIEVTGVSLEVNSNYIPIAAKLVAPLDLTEDRLFAPWHELNLYKSKASMEAGLRTYEASCTKKGIDNYVLIVMTPAVDFHESSIDAVVEALANIKSDTALRERAAEAMPEFQYIIYFACLQLHEELCWAAIRQGVEKDDLEEFETYISDMDAAARLCSLHEKTYEAKPKIKRDYYEIGYPAKFGNKLLDDEGWEIQEIRRYGTLKANGTLADEAIVADLRGADGNNKQKYNKRFNPKSKAELAEVRLGVQRCLEDNAIWRNQLIRVLDDFMPQGKNFEATLSVFNPANLCLALFLQHSTENGSLYIPGYSLLLESGGQLDAYIFGSMVPTGGSPSFKALLEKYHSGSGAAFLSSLSWGGYDSRDVQISRDLGMTYKTFKLDLSKGLRQFYELTEWGWEQCAEIHPDGGFAEYIEKNTDFFADVIEYYSAHSGPGFHMHDAGIHWEFRT